MKLASDLQTHIVRFRARLDDLRMEVDSLIIEIKKAEANYITEVNIPLNLNKSIDREFEIINSNIEAKVNSSANSITHKLDNFISDEVTHRLRAKLNELGIS